MKPFLLFSGILAPRVLFVPVSAASYQKIPEQPLIKECQVQTFTEDAQVKAHLSQWDTRKWAGKLDYITTRLKETIVDKHVPGAVVELGVLEGRTSRIIRRFIDHFAPHREFHVYDSFKGLPARRQEDGKQQRREDGEGGMKVPLQAFRKGFVNANLRLPNINISNATYT